MENTIFEMFHSLITSACRLITIVFAYECLNTYIMLYYLFVCTYIPRLYRDYVKFYYKIKISSDNLMFYNLKVAIIWPSTVANRVSKQEYYYVKIIIYFYMCHVFYEASELSSSKNVANIKLKVTVFMCIYTIHTKLGIFIIHVK